MEFLIAAISLGFLGSFHCIGMCGPIALALPINTTNYFHKVLLILSYNFGRIVTYSAFGLLFGLIGMGFAIAGYQQIVSIVIGSLLLLGVIIPSRYFSKYKITSSVFIFFNQIKTALGKLFLKSGHKSLFLIGLLNGLLPCGLVYMAVAGAIATGDITKGVLFMAVFGLGTVPVMLSLPLIGNFISIPVRNQIRKSVPVIVGIMAILLILRGLNLGIPYISPKIDSDTNRIASCHSQKTTLDCCHKK